MKLISHVNGFWLALCLLMISTASFSEQGYWAYKWVDETGSTHFSQVPPPPPAPAEIIKINPSAAITPIVSEFETAEPEADATEQNEQQQTSEDQLAQQQQAFAENCKIAKENKQLYQDNPGRRFIDADGNVTRLTEEERQAKIQESQKQIDFYCK